jgi:protein phosphatase
MLTESHKVLYKDHENLATSMQETTATYGQFALSLGKEDFAQARNRVDQLAQDILSYKFKPKEENLPRRTQAVDRLRKLLRMTRDHRPGRVNQVAEEFNKTLGEMKDKFAAVPEEVKDKLVETTISMMKDFKEAYDDALRGYGKRKGRTAREKGETKIKELNSQLQKINENLDKRNNVNNYYKQFEVNLQNIQQKSLSLPENISEKFHETLGSLSRQITDLYQSILKGNIETIKADDEAKIKELSTNISKMSKDLDRWHLAQDAQRDLLKSAKDGQECQSLEESRDGIRKSYERVLDAYRQGSDQSDARVRFGEATQEILGKKAIADLEKEWEKYAADEQYQDMVKKLEKGEKLEEDNDIKHNMIMLKNLKDLLVKEYVYASFKQYQEFIIKNNDSSKYNINKSIFDKIEDTVNMYKDLGEETTGAFTKGKNPINQDAYFINERKGIYAVFDGIGGYPGGHIASAIAVDYLIKSSKVSNELNMKDIFVKINDEIVQHKNKNNGLTFYKHRELGYIGYNEMGTTASIVKITEGGKAIMGNVGDSRVYLLRNGSQSVEHLTLDDAQWVEIFEGRPSNQKSAKDIQRELAEADNPGEKSDKVSFPVAPGAPACDLTKALGLSESVELNIEEHPLKPGDMLSITSDGVHDVLKDSRIANCILRNGRDAKKAGEALVQEAEDEKGTPRSKRDDRTAVVIRYAGKGADSTRSNKDKGKAKVDVPSTSSDQ